MPESTLPIDPKVADLSIVKRAAAAAEAAHRAAYPPSDPAVTPEPEPAPAAATPEPSPAPAPPAPPPFTAPLTAPVSPDAPDWEHRCRSMEGRWRQSQQMVGSLQEQLQQMGDELQRVNTILNQRPPEPPRPVVTDAERQLYGDEMLETMARVAASAVAPDVAAVKAENNQLKQKLARVDAQGVYNLLDTSVPNWREINGSDRFKAWCRLPDLYSGVLRGRLLNDAFRAGDAPRVARFFKGFLTEEVVTGQEPAPQPLSGQSPTTPRTAAVELETLTAPGRARPAQGNIDPSVPADKPVFTRAQVARFYDDVRRRVYEGRDDEKNRLEQQIFAAQREGRVR